MIRSAIKNTPFTEKGSGELIPNINGTSWNDDVTFVATLRALFGNRMKPDDGLDFTTECWPVTSNYTSDFNGAASTIEAMRKSRGLFMLVDCRTYVSANEDAILDGITAHVTKSIPTFREVNAARGYFGEDGIKCVAFIDDENHNALVVALNICFRFEVFHKLQATVLSIFHWFEKKQENGKYRITSAEMEMINALTQPLATLNDYTKAMKKVYSEFEKEGENGRIQS